MGDDVVGDESSGLDDAADVLDEFLVEAAGDGALEDFADFISGGDVVVAEVFSEQFGVGALADAWGSEEEEEFLFGGGEGVEELGGESHHHKQYLIYTQLTTTVTK